MIKCNADERCLRRLDGAEHLFAKQMRTNPDTPPVKSPPNRVVFLLV